MKKTIVDFNHLKKVNQKYWPHFVFAIKAGFYLIFTGIISIIHGVFPFFWPFKTPGNIIKIHRILKSRKEYYEDVLRSMEK